MKRTLGYKFNIRKLSQTSDVKDENQILQTMQKARENVSSDEFTMAKTEPKTDAKD